MYPRSRIAFILVAALSLATGACSRHDSRIQQHKEHFESLGSTTAAIAEAWLSGSASGTYTRTALEQTFLLVEKERTALAKRPEMLLDPRGAHLSEATERLSRLIALLIGHVNASDGESARRLIAAIPITSADER